MFSCIKKIIRSPLAELALIAIICLNFFPGISFWYDLNSLQTLKRSYVPGEEISLFIDYKSKTDNKGWARIRIYRESVGEPEIVYEDIGPLKHSLPIKFGQDGGVDGTPVGWVIGALDNVSLDRPGFYKIDMCVRVEVPFFSSRDKCVQSNIFELKSKE